MNRKNPARLLEDAAAEHIPAELDLAPAILTRIRSEQRRIMRPKTKMAAVLAVVALALLAVTGIAYAVYRLIGTDPGLQRVQDAGLTEPQAQTANPTLQPTYTPEVEKQEPLALNRSQTQAGVTLMLNWVLLEQSRLSLGLSFSPLPDGLTLGAPEVAFHSVEPMQARGWTQVLDPQTGRSQYVSYQVINDATASLSVDVPLRQDSPEQAISLANFHFDLDSIPVARNQDTPLQQTYGVRVNGLEMRLQSLRVTPAASLALLCYDLPGQAGEDWHIQNASLRFDQEPPLPASGAVIQTNTAQERCALLSFPTGDLQTKKTAFLRVEQLAVPGTAEAASGPWEFFVGLPLETELAGSREPAGQERVGQQTLEDVSIALDWTFVDARRAAVGYTITGLPDVPDAGSLLGLIELKDDQGQPVGGAGIGSSSISWVEGQPGVVRGVWSSGFDHPLTAAEASFSLDITLDGTSPENVIAYFPYPPDAQPFPPGVFPPTLPEGLVGTYHFEFTAQVNPLQTLTEIAPVSANGTLLSIPQLQITASFAEALVCFNKPTAQDWWVMSASLSAGDQEASLSGGSLVYDRDIGIDNNRAGWTIPAEIQTAEHGRCLALQFMLGHGGRGGSLQLRIPQLEVSPPEVIPDGQIQAARQALSAQGIEMDYSTYTSGGGGGGGVSFTKLPPGMTAQQANQKLMEFLGYVHAGPWNFTFEVNP